MAPPQRSPVLGEPRFIAVFQVIKTKINPKRTFLLQRHPKRRRAAQGAGLLAAATRFCRGATTTCVCSLQLPQPTVSPGARPRVRPSARAVLEGFGLRWQVQRKAQRLSGTNTASPRCCGGCRGLAAAFPPAHMEKKTFGEEGRTG